MVFDNALKRYAIDLIRCVNANMTNHLRIDPASILVAFVNIHFAGDSIKIRARPFVDAPPLSRRHFCQGRRANAKRIIGRVTGYGDLKCHVI